jgi:hypothetical protein
METVFKLSLAISLIFSLVSPIHAASEEAQEADEIELKDISLDKPLILDEDADYRLTNVTVHGLTDSAALTLAGRIRSVILRDCSFGRIWAGIQNRAAGLQCSGAFVAQFTAIDTTFFDAENYLASLKEGSFGKVTFERCRFYTSESFLKEIYAGNPWRTAPPVTEFHNIDRLELLDNEYSNTTIVIHPSVKQVVIRGQLPGLKIENLKATQIFLLSPHQPATVAPPLRLPSPGNPGEG